MNYNCANGYIITWILRQIFMFCNKWDTQRAKKRFPISTLLTNPLPSYWMNWSINEFHVSKLIDDKFSSVIISTYILHPLLYNTVLNLSYKNFKLALLGLHNKK